MDQLAKAALDKGLINAEEQAILVKAEESRLRTINVDEFEPEALAAAVVPEKEPVEATHTEKNLPEKQNGLRKNEAA